MFNQLTSIGVAVVVFALVIGVGTIVLQQFTVAVGCPSLYTYNTTAQNCYLTSNASVTADPNAAGSTVGTVQGYLGTSSGGLASWTPAIIALAVGLLFIGSLMVLQGRKA